MKRLAAKEEELMHFFWKKGALYVKEIQEMYDDPRPHFNTISTVVRGLEEKGFLSHTAYGRSFQYHAVITQDEYGKRNLKGFIAKYFNNSYLGVVSTLVKEEEISVDELKQLIEEVERGNKK